MDEDDGRISAESVSGSGAYWVGRILRGYGPQLRADGQPAGSDENILEIIASVAFRNFSNRLNVALGLDDPDNLPELDPDLDEMLGAREASHVNI